MKRRARDIQLGDHVEGAEVTWVLPLLQRNLVIVGLDVPDPGGERGSATQSRRYRPDDLVDVDPRPHSYGLMA